MSNYLIGLSAIHVALMMGYWIFLRKERQYATVRAYLITTVVIALVVPALKLPRLWIGDEPLSVVYTRDVALNPVAIVPSEQSSFWTSELLTGVYALISLFFLLKLFASLRYLAVLGSRNSREKSGGLWVYRIRNIPGSFSFLNWIFITEEIEKDSEAYEIMVAHEKAHADLGHTYDLIFLELFRACFWWLPTAWYLNREIKKIHEYQADGCVLGAYSADQYSSILIGATLNIHGMGPVSSFNEGSILKRLKVMRQQTKNVSPWKLVVLATLCTLLVIGFGCTEDKESSTKTTDDSNLSGKIFVVVEKAPEYEGGIEGYYNAVRKEIGYPSEARQKGIEGRVDVQFVIEKDGSLSHVKAVNAIGGGCEQEAVRAFNSIPSFIPASQNGKQVKVRMMAPITFKLDRSEGGTPKGVIIVENLQPINAKLKIDANYSNGEWKGTVYDEERDKLPGVNILIEGTSKGTTSDLSGAFTLKAEEADNLVFSFMGYDFAKLGAK